MQIFNHYSFLLSALIVVMVVVVALWRWKAGPMWLRLAGVGVILAATVGVGFVFRYPASEAATVQNVETVLNNGQPTFLVFYSNYCLGCMASLPTVRALENDLDTSAVNVLLIDIHTDTGETLRRSYRANVTPTYIILDASGQEKWRGHRVPSETEILNHINS